MKGGERFRKGTWVVRHPLEREAALDIALELSAETPAVM